MAMLEITDLAVRFATTDGTVSAVGLLAGSPEGDDYTTYFTMVGPVLAQWGLRVLP